ncbi:hypothetical protein [uncultured Muribaculum sp.]|uniref:hypothetical protein n=1 Tax=uncultured Muribaculum sp. TaxID=1918613 RepID=UPI002623C598|nr:hypothetical protein [uncultured Muribaculum sp.]
MEALSVSDYRNNLAASFDRADEGERVLIRRKNSLYALISVGREELSLSPKQQRQVDELAASIRRSWEQVKMLEEGKLPRRTVQDMLNEL